MASHAPTDITWEMKLPGQGWLSSYGGVNFSPAPRESDRIRITRALADQQTSISPANTTFTINNRNGDFSPRNALSPLFGKIGLNTQIRLGVQKSGTWDEYLRMPDVNSTSTGQRVYTADKASLRVTGDIDIRFEYSSFYSRVYRFALAGRWNVSSAERCWFIDQRDDGQLALQHSPDGTLGAVITSLSGDILDGVSGRIAVRVTLDVDDGSGNHVYKWYTSDSIDGTWVQFGATQTVTGTTSIFAGSVTDLEVGSANGANGPFTGERPFTGKIYALQVYDGIAGTLVADFTPAGQGIYSEGWTDSCASPNTWVISGSNIRTASDRIRFSGEVSSWPEVWDNTGIDRYCRLSASSVIKRYQSNKGPLASPIYRLYRNYPDLRGYWPLEDQSGATQAFNAVSRGAAGVLTSCTFGSADGLDGSSGSLTLSSAPNVSEADFRADLTPAATGYSTILFYFKLASLPSTDQILLTLNSVGTATRWTMTAGATGYSFNAFDKFGASLSSSSIGYGTGASPLDQWVGMQIFLSQDGSNIRYETAWHAVGTNVFYTHTVGGTTFAGTLGKGFYQATFGTPDAAFAGTQLAHVIIAGSQDLDLVSNLFANVSKGYAGEQVGDRMNRLCVEEGVAFEWLGDLGETADAGPQQADTLYNLMAAAALADGGILGDGRDFNGYRYISSKALGNRRGITFDYSASELGSTPNPIVDDRYTVNDFTASRIGGSTGARFVADDNRPLSINDPDADTNPGAGRYERGQSYNTYTDDQMLDIAGQQVAIGTWNESRIPNLDVALHRSQVAGSAMLLADTIAADFGDPAGLTGLADSPLPPEDLVFIVFGYTETIHNFEWQVVANTVPAGPYQVPILGTSDVNGEPRMDADYGGHVVVHANGTVSSGATSMIWRTDRNFRCQQVIDSVSYAAEFPCDFTITGEQMTLTACTAPSSNADIADGTFELGTTGWTQTNSTLAQSTTFAHGGTHSALMTVSGSPVNATLRTDSAYAVPVTPGVDYTVSAWVRSTALLSDVRATLDWYTAANVYISTTDSGSASLASGSWVQRTATGTAPATAAFARYGTTIAASPSTGTLLYSDDISLSTTRYNYQTATLTRAVNGISKMHDSGDEIHLTETFLLGRL